MMVKQEGETLIQHCIHAGGERQPHCAAIASAIPWNVVERSFHVLTCYEYFHGRDD